MGRPTKALIAAQRQLDIRVQAARAVEDDRDHRNGQWVRWLGREGLRLNISLDPRWAYLSEPFLLRAIGAS